MTAYSGGVPVAEVVRSGFAESRHHGSVVALDARGTPVLELGDPHHPIYPRSSNKPLQAVGMLRAGLNLPDPADLAVVAASHYGEPAHVDRVRAMLARAGLSESDLRCPPELPLSAEARAAVVRTRGRAAPIFMNCSGKHAGMVLTCLAAGWSRDDYLDPEHPLQRRCAQTVAELAECPVTHIGVDGCGAPVLAIPLLGLARAFLRLVSAAPGTPQRQVADAARAYPKLGSGTGADDARLMSAVAGLLAKGGAEGVLAVALPGVGAVALKIDDGAARAKLPVLAAALARLGLRDEALAEVCRVPVFGGGELVGFVRSLL